MVPSSRYTTANSSSMIAGGQLTRQARFERQIGVTEDLCCALTLMAWNVSGGWLATRSRLHSDGSCRRNQDHTFARTHVTEP
jgi:hypothetical protein